MKPIPSDIWEQYSAVLKKRAVPVPRHADYRKWLRYYLDFRSKYSLPDSRSEHVRLFIQKLREKKQSPEQQKQAAHALSLFFESQTMKVSESEKQDTMELFLSMVSLIFSSVILLFLHALYSNLTYGWCLKYIDTEGQCEEHKLAAIP